MQTQFFFQRSIAHRQPSIISPPHTNWFQLCSITLSLSLSTCCYYPRLKNVLFLKVHLFSQESISVMQFFSVVSHSWLEECVMSVDHSWLVHACGGGRKGLTMMLNVCRTGAEAKALTSRPIRSIFYRQSDSQVHCTNNQSIVQLFFRKKHQLEIPC